MLFVIITVDVLLLGEIKMLKKGLRLFLAFLLVVVVLTMLTYIFMFDNYTVVTVNDDIRLYIFNQERSIFLGDNPKYAIITYEFVLPFISDIESVDELRYTLAQYFSYMADTRSVTQDVIDKQHKE
jgi:hypothetical protein